jgi:pimeloyl-ACP methyl ester carboxylesterase
VSAQPGSSKPIDQVYEVQNNKVAALIFGERSARPVLFLHGWLDNAASFSRIFEYFAGFYCIAPDFPGHGWSAHHPAGISYHFIDLVSFIDDFSHAIGAAQFDIVGHSMGGAAATLFAAACPDKVRSLCLIDTLGPLTDTPSNSTLRLRDHLRARSSRGSISRKFGSIDEAIQYRVKTSFIPTSVDAARDIVQRGLRRSGESYEWTHDQRLKLPSAYRMTPDQLHQVLADVQCPTLVIRADPGIELPEQDWQQRLSQVKNCKLKSLLGHHHIHADQPEVVGVTIKEFLNSH